MSIVTKSIVNADAEARYLSPGELDRLKAFVTSGERRVRIALITYGVVAGDVAPIEEIGLVGAREMYNSLGTSIPAMAESIRCMMSVAGAMMSGEDAAEAASYFDYGVAGLM